MTRKIRVQEDNKFNKEWGKFISYLKEHCKQLKTLAGFLQCSENYGEN